MDKRILILDDNQDILEMVAEALTYEGYIVKTTGRKPEFENLLESWQPHTVILDFKLADGNGGDICLEIKQNSRTKHIPVILFSACFNQAKDLAEFGCDAVMTKPFDLEELVACVRQVFN